MNNNEIRGATVRSSDQRCVAEKKIMDILRDNCVLIDPGDTRPLVEIAERFGLLQSEQTTFKPHDEVSPHDQLVYRA